MPENRAIQKGAVVSAIVPDGVLPGSLATAGGLLFSRETQSTWFRGPRKPRRGCWPRLRLNASILRPWDSIVNQFGSNAFGRQVRPRCGGGRKENA
jgi:hypothetical protein